MPRQQIIELFQRESGRAYDPQVVAAFIANLERMETAGKAVDVTDNDVWGIQEPEHTSKGARQLERVQPTVSYGKALSGTPDVQRELYSIFEFTRAGIQCLSTRDVLTFMASKLTNLIHFDAVVFYTANLSEGIVTAEHVAGSESQGLLGLRLGLEQKLTGWVAANNQALCNLPPFPDFLRCEEPRPTFQLSAVAPMNRNGTVLGAISLYRKDPEKFTEQEFRQLEIVASQTAIAISKCHTGNDETPLLFDSTTGIPNGFQLYLMFDQIAMDANKFEYPLALFSIHLDDLKDIRRRWGHLSGDESVRVAAKHLARELRETDVLARYAADEFVTLSPRMNEEQAETLKSRLQNELDHFRFPVRPDTEISIPVSIGIAIFPRDGTDIETLLSVAERRMHEDRDLRTAAKRRIRYLSLSQSI
jgi:diguanylate cyclase (GGDEF)-like protein